MFLYFSYLASQMENPSQRNNMEKYDSDKEWVAKFEIENR
jgi:hypothetical protein